MTEMLHGWIAYYEAWERGMCPLLLYDAGGNLIRRVVRAFNAETGEVDSAIIHRDGKPLKLRGGVVTVRERYKPPLMWRSCTRDEAAAVVFDGPYADELIQLAKRQVKP